MTLDAVTELFRSAVVLTLLVSAPVLVVAVVVGLLISILQAVTQIQDQTVNIVPKLVVMMLTMLFLAPWTLTMLMNYATDVFAAIPDSLH